MNGIWYLSQRGAEAKKDHGWLLDASPDTTTEHKAGCTARDGDQCLTGVLKRRRQRKSAIGPEDLAAWPNDSRVWSIAEFKGMRAMYAM